MDEENINQSNFEESPIDQIPQLSPLRVNHDIAYYVQMTRQALDEKRNVALLDLSHTISAFVLRDISNQLNFEMDDQTAVYVSLKEVTSFTEFVSKLTNGIFFNVTDNDDELSYDARHYITTCENDVQNRRGIPGEMYSEIHLYLGDKPAEESMDLLYDVDQMLHEKKCRIVLIVDDMDRVEKFKEKADFAKLLCKLMRMDNISLVAAYQSKEVLESVTNKLRSPECLSLDLTPLGYQKPKALTTDPAKMEHRRGRKPGSKNKKSSDNASVENPVKKSSAKESESMVLKKCKYVRRQVAQDTTTAAAGTDLAVARSNVETIDNLPTEDKSMTQPQPQPQPQQW